jgi:hypothetical protein
LMETELWADIQNVVLKTSYDRSYDCGALSQ